MNVLYKIAIVALILAVAGKARATETTGGVAGFVYDPTGAALSEVPLTISGPALQQPESRTTGDDGRYEFTLLPPAEDYVIEVNVPGFTPIRQQGVKVRLGQTTSVDINLTVLTEQSAAETYEIVEKANPVLNPDSAQTVAVINAEQAAMKPSFHQVEGMAQEVAGVGPGNRPSTRGGLARHGRFFVDGLDTTDITDGSITAPMNFDAVQNFEIITGGFDAQYNSMGMITNAVTKNGGNELKLDASLTLSPPFMYGQDKFPASQTPFFGNYVDNPAQAPQHFFYSPIVNIGGPIVKDKLWFYASYQQNFNRQEIPVIVTGAQVNRAQDTTTTLGRFKLTWQPTEEDRVTLGVNLDRNVTNNYDAGLLVAQEADSKLHRGGEFVLLNYDHSFTDSVLFQVQAGMTYKQVDQDPIYDDFLTPNHFDVATLIQSENAGRVSFSDHGNYLHETKYRMQFDPMISWKMKGLGTHQFKAGVQYSWLIDRQSTGATGDQSFTDSGGICNPNDPSTYQYCFLRTQYQGNQGGSLATRASVSNIGMFIQDRWQVNRRLTVIPGMRVDVGILYGDPYANPPDANGVRSSNAPVLTNLAGIGPRLSGTFDVFGDRRTLAIASYGRNNDVGNAFIAQHGNPALTEFQGQWNSGSKTFPDCITAFNAAPPAGCVITGARSIPYHSLSSPMKPPHVDEILVGLHHEVVPETVIGVDYDYRAYNNMWEDIETNRIWDVSGTKIIGYQQNDPAHVGRSIVVSTTANEAWRKYRGIDFWIQGTPGRWDLLAAYTLAYNWGTVSDYFDGYLLNPRMNQFYEGYVPDDRRHTIKASVAYRTLFGLDLGARVQYRSGTPGWEGITNPGDVNQRIYKTQRGTGAPVSPTSNAPNFNDPSQWTELRNPDVFNLDLQARYNLGALLNMRQSRLDLVLLVVNTLSDSAASNLTDTYKLRNNNFAETSSFGHFQPIQGEVLIRYRN